MSELDRSEHMRLRKFAEYILRTYSWGHDIDGGDAQDMAEKLGLIELRPINPEDAIDDEKEHFFPVWADREDENGKMLP